MDWIQPKRFVFINSWADRLQAILDLFRNELNSHKHKMNFGEKINNKPWSFYRWNENDHTAFDMCPVRGVSPNLPVQVDYDIHAKSTVSTRKMWFLISTLLARACIQYVHQCVPWRCLSDLTEMKRWTNPFNLVWIHKQMSISYEYILSNFNKIRLLTNQRMNELFSFSSFSSINLHTLSSFLYNKSHV